MEDSTGKKFLKLAIVCFVCVSLIMGLVLLVQNFIS